MDDREMVLAGPLKILGPVKLLAYTLLAFCEERRFLWASARMAPILPFVVILFVAAIEGSLTSS